MVVNVKAPFISGEVPIGLLDTGNVLSWVEISLSTFSIRNMFIYYTVCIMCPTNIFKVYFLVKRF